MGNDASWVSVVDVCRRSLVRARVWARGRSKHILLHEQSQAVESADRDSDAEEPAEQVEYQDSYSIMENDSGLDYQLPQHQQCACHLLNLISTTDSAWAETNSESYKRLSGWSFAICQAMWNKTVRTTLAAEVVENEYKLQ